LGDEKGMPTEPASPPSALSESRGNGGDHPRLFGEGFVDEAMVSAMIAGGVYGRFLREQDGLVLSSCEDDYADWALPPPPVSFPAVLLPHQTPPDFP